MLKLARHGQQKRARPSLYLETGPRSKERKAHQFPAQLLSSRPTELVLHPRRQFQDSAAAAGGEQGFFLPLVTARLTAVTAPTAGVR
jgi:hypothetical protein